MLGLGEKIVNIDAVTGSHMRAVGVVAEIFVPEHKEVLARFITRKREF